jgi:hypothetical protein
MCWADLSNDFYFKSLGKVIEEATPKATEVQIVGIASLSLTELDKDKTRKIVLDYFPNIARKDELNNGLSGVSLESFNWYKKKNYVYKLGYKSRPSALKDVNSIISKPDEINNVHGYHEVGSYSITGDKELTKYQASAKISNAIFKQMQTKILINGSTQDRKIKPGNVLDIKYKAKDYNENITELAGKWLIVEVDHIFDRSIGLNYKCLVTIIRINKEDK